MESLLEWVSAQGGRFGALQFTGRTPYATSDLKPGDELCFIPSHILISASNAPKVDLKNEYSEIMALTRHLVTLKSQKHPYALSLPEKINLPISWPQNMIDLLNGTNMESMISSRRQVLSDWLDHFLEKGDTVTFEELVWAHECILSRAFPRVSETPPVTPGLEWIAVSELGMFPLLDMLNHKTALKINWIMSPQGVSFVTREPITKGSQVYNNYGAKGNENLLFHYGFVMENNPHDYYKVTLGLSQLDPLYSRKMDVLNVLFDGKIPWAQLLFQNELPADLVKVSSVIACNSFELLQFEKNPLGSHDFGTRATLTALETLLHLLMKKFKVLKRSYSTALSQPQDDRVSSILIYIKGQMTILETDLNVIDQSFLSLLEASPHINFADCDPDYLESLLEPMDSEFELPCEEAHFTLWLVHQLAAFQGSSDTTLDTNNLKRYFELEPEYLAQESDLESLQERYQECLPFLEQFKDPFRLFALADAILSVHSTDLTLFTS